MNRADTATPTAAPATATAIRAPREGLAAIVELSKPRITRLVTITAGVGFTLGAVGRPWTPADLALRAIACVVGTALASAGANALNMWWERDRDALMRRTAHRPLPEARITPRLALGAGLAFSLAGVLTLLLIGLAPALVAASTIIIYVLAYTPLKPVTVYNTLVGAIPGALPPLIGWTAAAQATTGHFDLHSLAQLGGWSLFVLMVIWQIPHFLAIAWMYREDYARGGYRMLPVGDPLGSRTAASILAWAAALIPATIWPGLVLHDRLSPVYPIIALLTGVAYFALCVRLARRRTAPNARAVFFASIIHLPLLLMAMVADALIGRI